MPIGAHVGVAAGYANAVDYAVSVGAECLQIFAKSPRQWHARPLSPVVTGQFGARIADVGMGPVLVHTAYLINLGNHPEDTPSLRFHGAHGSVWVVAVVAVFPKTYAVAWIQTASIGKARIAPRITGEGHGNPLQSSRLETPM